MSRGYDFEERDDDREQEREQKAPLEQSPLAQGRGGGSSEAPEGARARPRRERVPERLPSPGTRGRVEVRVLGKRYDLTARERDTLREIGRFRTIAADDLLKYCYGGKAAALRKELVHLQQQGLLQETIDLRWQTARHPGDCRSDPRGRAHVPTGR